jgi:hypothetical protein
MLRSIDNGGLQEQMLNRLPASLDGGSCLGARAAAGLLALLAVLALGIQVGLMIDIAGSEATQAHALAPSTDGGDAMAYCVVVGPVQGIMQGARQTGVAGVLPAAVTRALGKGCTLVGGLIMGDAPWQSRFMTGAQPMLCPKALVGTTPMIQYKKDGNVGECVV